MDAEEYKENLRKGLEGSFDFKAAPECLQPYADIWAVYNQVNEKYFLSKKVSLYSMNNDEYVSVVSVEELSPEFLFRAREVFAGYISSLKVQEGHMSSLFTLAIISPNEISSGVIDSLSKLKFHKDFCFTFKGWADWALVLIDLKNRKVYSNAKGKASIKNFQSFLELN